MKNEKIGVEAIARADLLKYENRSFIVKLLLILGLYFALSAWLDANRSELNVALLWIAILFQLLFYSSIFLICFNRARVFQLNRNAGIILFSILFWLGRVEDLELVLIPVLAITMIVLSGVNKKVSPRGEMMIPKPEASHHSNSSSSSLST